MKVHIKYFASIREALACGGETLDTSASTVAALRDALIARGGAYATVLGATEADSTRATG